jgi:hypothetical protein
MAKKKSAKHRKARPRVSESDEITIRAVRIEMPGGATVIISTGSSVYCTNQPYGSTTCCTCQTGGPPGPRPPPPPPNPPHKGRQKTPRNR